MNQLTQGSAHHPQKLSRASILRQDVPLSPLPALWEAVEPYCHSVIGNEERKEVKRRQQASSYTTALEGGGKAGPRPTALGPTLPCKPWHTLGW